MNFQSINKRRGETTTNETRSQQKMFQRKEFVPAENEGSQIVRSK